MMDGSGGKCVKCVKKPLVTQGFSQKRLLPVPARLLEGECVRSAAWLSHQGPSGSLGLPDPASVRQLNLPRSYMNRSWEKVTRCLFLLIVLNVCFRATKELRRPQELALTCGNIFQVKKEKAQLRCLQMEVSFQG